MSHYQPSESLLLNEMTEEATAKAIKDIRLTTKRLTLLSASGMALHKKPEEK